MQSPPAPPLPPVHAICRRCGTEQEDVQSVT